MERVQLLAPIPKDLDQPVMVTAFAGWADAQEGGSRTLRYILRRSGAVKFASIDPEEFYDFTQSRPFVFLDDRGERAVRWPTNEFFYARASRTRRDLVLLLGIEPNLKWRTFTSTVVDIARLCNVRDIVNVGALLDAVPHTREPRVTGVATEGPLRERFMELGLLPSAYQGPTGLPTALMERCRQVGLNYGSIMGHAPHYLQVGSNPRVARTMLSTLVSALDISIDLRDIQAREASFDRDVAKVIEANPEIKGYIERLEQAYDAMIIPPTGPLPEPETLLKDLEEFLRQRRRDVGEGPGGAPPPSGEGR